VCSGVYPGHCSFLRACGCVMLYQDGQMLIGQRRSVIIGCRARRVGVVGISWQRVQGKAAMRVACPGDGGLDI